MQQGHAPTSDDRPLPRDFAVDLPPRLREALSHPMRRAILRTLNSRSQPVTLAKLALLEIGGATGTVSYHLRVLESCGSVSVSAVAPDQAESVWRYASNLADNRQAISVLEATKPLDDSDD